MPNSIEQAAASRSTEDHTCSFGMLQQFGSWVALRAVEGNRYVVIAASDNSKLIIGHTPEDLFSLNCFSDLLPGGNRDEFRTRLTAWEQTNPEFRSSNISEIFYSPIISANTSGPDFWCTLSSARGFADVWICEFEPCLQGPDIQVGLRTPIRQLEYKSTPKEWVESTTRKSMPLSASRGVQECLSTITTASLTLFFNKIQSQLVSSTSMEMLFDRVVGIVSELTKFDRTLVYRVDEGQCGVVVAECLNPVASKDLLIGLRFQESNNTSQTAVVFKEERVQLLRNRLQQPASIICRDEEYIGKLDLTGSYLRQISLDQMETFSDMDVSSSMALALVVRNELWGSIICHSYGSHITPILPPVRKICRDIGNYVSSQIERLLDKESFDAQATVVTGILNLSPRGFITKSPGSLLKIFAADFGAIILNDEIQNIGEIGARHEALALIQYFRTQRVTSISASQNIKKDFRDLEYQPGFSTVAGTLVIPLLSNGADFLVLFRKGQLIETREEGYTRERFQRLDGRDVEPSAGFARWEKYVANRSSEWTECQLELSAFIKIQFMIFGKIWSESIAVEPQSRNRCLLLSEPLEDGPTLDRTTGDHEITLEDPMDQHAEESTDIASTDSQSSESAIENILNLTLSRAERSDQLPYEQDFVLHTLVLGIIDKFRGKADRKGLGLALDMDTTGLPVRVRGDPQGLRKALSNLLSNSVENSVRGDITLGVKAIEGTETEATVEITIQDQGVGMSEEQLNRIFQDLDELTEDSLSNQDAQISDLLENVGRGFIEVTRWMQTIRGQIEIESEKGKGTTVSLQLPLLYL